MKLSVREKWSDRKNNLDCLFESLSSEREGFANGIIMKRRFAKFSFSLLFFLLITACLGVESDAADIKYASGTVKYISLEGGFYGIVTDDNKYLDPINLSKEFQKDGMRIFIKYVEKKDMASFHMWGTIVEIVEVHELK